MKQRETADAADDHRNEAIARAQQHGAQEACSKTPVIFWEASVGWAVVMCKSVEEWRDGARHPDELASRM